MFDLICTEYWIVLLQNVHGCALRRETQLHSFASALRALWIRIMFAHVHELARDAKELGGRSTLALLVTIGGLLAIASAVAATAAQEARSQAPVG